MIHRNDLDRRSWVMNVVAAGVLAPRYQCELEAKLR